MTKQNLCSLHLKSFTTSFSPSYADESSKCCIFSICLQPQCCSWPNIVLQACLECLQSSIPGALQNQYYSTWSFSVDATKPWSVLLFFQESITVTLLHSLHWLLITSRIDWKLSSLCFSLINVKGPEYLSELLTIYIPSWWLHSASDTRLSRIPSFKTMTNGQSCFSF